MEKTEEELRQEAIRAQKQKRIQRAEEEKRQKIEEELRQKEKIKKEKKLQKEKKQSKKNEIKKQKETQALVKYSENKKIKEKKIKEKQQKKNEKEKTKEQRQLDKFNKYKKKELEKLKKQEDKKNQEKIETKNIDEVADFEKDENQKEDYINKYLEERRLKQEQRNKAIKKKKKIKLFRNVFFILIFLVICLICYILNEPKYIVSDVRVIGNTKVSSEDVIALSEISGKNILKLNSFTIEDKIRKNAYVQNATIKRQFPNTVTIYVTERIPQFINEKDGVIYILDKQGYIIDVKNSEQEISQDNSLISIDGVTIGNVNERLSNLDLERLEDIYEIEQIIKENGYEIVVSKYEFSNNNIAIYIENGQKKVELGDSSNLQTKFLKLSAILEKIQNKKGTIYLNESTEKSKEFFREE